MSRIPIGSAVAFAASAVLLVTLAATAAPPEDKPDKAAKAEARLEAKAERKAEQKAQAEARAETRSVKQAARVAAKAERQAATAEAKDARQAAKVERKQAKQKLGKVRLCHKPETSDEVTITVGAPAAKAHLAHGDYLGECGAPPIVVTISGPDLINPDDRLRLDGDATAMTTSEVSYVWSSSCFADDQLIDLSIIAARPNIALLIIRENKMSAGSSCTFTLTVTDESTGRVGSETVEVAINTPPQGGTITVVPSFGGFALETLFRLEATGWTDPDEPRSYQFFYTSAGSTDVTALTQLLPVSYADVYLPAGDLEVVVEVSDALAAASSASTSVTVLEP